MPENDHRKIQLQRIFDDPSSTEVERTEAKLALDQTQWQEDALLESWLRGEVEHDDRRFDQGLMDLRSALKDSRLFWLFGRNVEELGLLTALHSRSQSAVVRQEVVNAIAHIARYSTLPEARDQASEFLNQLDSQLSIADTKGRNEQPTAEPED